MQATLVAVVCLVLVSVSGRTLPSSATNPSMDKKYFRTKGGASGKSAVAHL